MIFLTLSKIQIRKLINSWKNKQEIIIKIKIKIFFNSLNYKSKNYKSHNMVE